MKKITLSVFICFLFATSYSQTYHPLIVPGKAWIEMEYDINQNPLCTYVSGVEKIFLGDTAILGTTYKKLGVIGVVSLCQCPYYCIPYAVDTAPVYPYPYYLREDTITQRVFAFNYNNSNSEQLLYDFSLSDGDSLNSPILGLGNIIDSVRSTTLNNGDVRKIYYLSYGGYYIESIGGANGLFNYPGLSVSSPGESLFCVSENGINLWGSYCFGTVGLNAHDNEASVPPKIITDKNNLYITLSSAPVKKCIFKIIDLNGRVLLTKELSEKESTINNTNFTPGIYCYEILFSDSEKLSGKFNILN